MNRKNLFVDHMIEWNVNTPVQPWNKVSIMHWKIAKDEETSKKQVVIDAVVVVNFQY